MKKHIIVSLLIVASTTLLAQNFSLSTDSVNATHQYGGAPMDTAGFITLTNASANPLQLKVSLHAEDVSPGFANIEFFYQFMHSFSTTFGFGYSDSIIVAGNDVVTFAANFPQPFSSNFHEVEVVVYEQNDSINTYQILSFTLVNCQTNTANIINDPTGSFCSTDSLTVSANAGYTSYNWSTGGTGLSDYVQASDLIYVEATDNLGCVSKDTANINVSVPYEEEICIVSVDSVTGKNIIVWEKTPNVGTQTFYIYKESFSAGVYNLIGFVDYDSLSVFIDVNSNPLQQAERYKITAIDSCGTESDINNTTDHKTIHLTASVGTSNENNLVWDGYEGFTFPTYNIYRGPNTSNMSLLAQVASSAFTYSDLTPLVGGNIYKIEVVRSATCTPTQKSTTYPSSISNLVAMGPVGVKEFSDVSIKLYPNPVNDVLSIDLGASYSNISVEVVNILGELILTKKYSSTSKVHLELDVDTGVYFVKISQNGSVITTKRVVKE